LDGPEGGETRNGHQPLSGLVKGDVIQVTERWFGDYWLGTCKERTGFFCLDQRVSLILTPKVRTLWWREREKVPEMPFQAGLELRLLYPRDHIWIWAMAPGGNDVGLIPFSFIEPVKPDEISSLGILSSSPTLDKPFGNQEWIASEVVAAQRHRLRILWEFSDEEPRFLNLARNDVVEVLAEALEDWWIGMVVPPEDVQPEPGSIERIGMFPREFGGTRTPSPTFERNLLHPPWSPYHVRALYTRKPEHSYEMGLVEGEIIEVQTVCSDLWWRGKKRDGDNGWFPENYVSPVLSRFHPMRRASMY